MSDSTTKRPNAVTAWMYRIVPKLPKAMRPKHLIVLHHVGRRTGEARTTGLQQIYHDAASGRHFVAAAYGPKSDWWRNVVENPNVSVELDGTLVEAVAEPLDADEAVDIMQAAIDENPRLRDQAFKHAGVAASDPDGIAKMLESNPLMAFRESQTDRL